MDNPLDEDESFIEEMQIIDNYIAETVSKALRIVSVKPHLTGMKTKLNTGDIWIEEIPEPSSIKQFKTPRGKEAAIHPSYTRSYTDTLRISKKKLL